MEKQAPSAVVKNYRFQMGLLRAYYDAYIRERLIHETALESEAREVLRNATIITIQEKIERAESILNRKWEKPVGYIYSYRAPMTTSNHLPNQLLMLSFGLKACKLYLKDSDSYGNTF